MRIENIKDLFKRITFIDSNSRKLQYKILTDLEEHVVVLVTTPIKFSSMSKKELDTLRNKQQELLEKQLNEQKAKILEKQETKILEKEGNSYKNNIGVYKEFFETPIDKINENLKELKTQYIKDLNNISGSACNTCAKKSLIRKYMHLIDSKLTDNETVN